MPFKYHLVNILIFQTKDVHKISIKKKNENKRERIDAMREFQNGATSE